MTAHLSSIPVDILSEVFEQLEAYDLGALWMSGDRLLMHKLRLGVTKFEWKLAPSKRALWPNLLSSFPNVRQASLGNEYHEYQLFELPGFAWSRIPNSLESLSIIFREPRRLQLGDQTTAPISSQSKDDTKDTAPCDTTNTECPTEEDPNELAGDRSQVLYFNKGFVRPNLTYLSIRCDTYLFMTVDLNWRQVLPKLRTLKVWSLLYEETESNYSPALTLTELPQTLTHLEGSYIAIIADDAWPPGLTRLVLEEVWESASAAFDFICGLPPSLLHLRWKSSTNVAIPPGSWKFDHLPHLQSLEIRMHLLRLEHVFALPRGLKLFSTITGAINSTENIVELLSHLPPGLETLRVGFPDPLSASEAAALPRTLTEIRHPNRDIDRHGSIQLKDDNALLCLPPNLTGIICHERLQPTSPLSTKTSLRYMLTRNSVEPRILPRNLTTLICTISDGFDVRSLQDLPSTLKTLEASGLLGTKLEDYKHLPSGLTTLKLSASGRPFLLVSSFSALPRHLTRLQIDQRMATDCDEFFEGLPTTLTELELRRLVLDGEPSFEPMRLLTRLSRLTIGFIQQKTSYETPLMDGWIPLLPRSLALVSLEVSNLGGFFKGGVTPTGLASLPLGLGFISLTVSGSLKDFTDDMFPPHAIVVQLYNGKSKALIRSVYPHFNEGFPTFS